MLRAQPTPKSLEKPDMSVVASLRPYGFGIHLIISLCFAFLLSPLTNAQINAVTETGDEVILFEDGSWVYLDNELNEATEIPRNPEEFVKPEASTFLVKSKKVDVGLWLQPKKWSFTREEDGGPNEYSFDLKNEDLYAMLLVEKVSMPIQTLKEIALQNARDVAPDTRITKQEMRNVNGLDVLMLQMTGTIQGIKFTYFGYYYTSETGTVQLLAYTSQALFDSYMNEIEQFLNGFVKL